MKSKIIAALIALMTSLSAHAQYNIDRLITSGEVALHYEDYVLSIQYFNKVLALKPYLWLPWYDRSIAKYYLDDYVGSEQDATKAIELNPYIEQLFDLRGITRIRQDKHQEAIADYTRAIRLNPSVSSFWLNRAICRMKTGDNDQALLDADTIIQRWANQATAYSLKAEIYLTKKDTTAADQWLTKSLAIDSYNADAWQSRAYIALNRKEWKQADSCLSRVIHLKPKQVNSYVNRALVRLNTNNLRGAMADYDMAIDLDPNNFLAHYNRGLLRVQLGDDNRAISDFDFVVRNEPQNFMAIYNRALLNDKVGKLHDAIRDYTTVIDQFPNFWAGLSARAQCYRKLGQTAKAELDEFKILKAQMDKHLGIQQRWSKEKLKEMRKRSEINLDKYNEIVVEDEPTIEHEYKSQYRGTIQNRDVEVAFLPMYRMSYFTTSNGVRVDQAYDADIDRFNTQEDPLRKLQLSCNRLHVKLSDTQSRQVFQLIESLTLGLGEEEDPKVKASLLLQRAVAYADAQNYADAINDLNDYLSQAKESVIGRWERAACQAMLNSFDASKGQNVSMQTSQAEGDFAEALKLSPRNAYLYYNRGNLYAADKRYDRAIADYTQAIELDGNLAEAWYNRGVAHYHAGRLREAQADLSKAGELGLYDAYALSKRLATKK